MKNVTPRSADVNNVGPLDRVNRIIVGMTLIVVSVLFSAIPATAVAAIVAVGLYAGLTGFIGWDPIYPVVKAFRQREYAEAVRHVPAHYAGESPAAEAFKKAA